MRRALVGLALLMATLLGCGTSIDEGRGTSAAAVAPATARLATVPPVVSGEPVVVALFFNVRQGHPFADVAVRRAIASCLELDALAAAGTSLAPPGARPTDHLLPTPPAVAGAAGVAPSATDPASARAALEAAGWSIGTDDVAVRDGVRLEAMEATPDGPAYRWAALTAAEAGLRRCGVATVRPQDFAGGLPITTDRVGFGLMAWPATPQGLASALGSAAATDGDLPDVSNWSGWADEATDRLLEALQEAPTDADAAAALAELERRISDRLPVIPLWLEP